MRFGLLTQWFDPEPGPAALPGVLARGLAARGHDVTVLTGFPNYPSGRLAPGWRQERRRTERVGGLDVTRVALYPSHDNSPLHRSLNYGSFAASATVSGLSALRDVDALWVSYSPVTVGLPMLLARARFGVPLVCWVGDVWPDTLCAGGFAPAGRLGSAASAAVSAWCGRLYAASERVVVISPGAVGLLAGRGVPEERIAYVPLWADEDRFAPATPAQRAAGEDLRRRLRIAGDDVVLLYAGALGSAQGLDTLVEATRLHETVEAAKAAGGPAGDSHRPRLHVVIAGSGTREADLRAQAARAGLGRVHFLGRRPPEEMPALLAAADAAYIGLAPHPLSAATMPSKTQASLAAGKALVVAADGDVAAVAADSGAGAAVGSGDAAGLSAILAGMCHRGRDGLAAEGRVGRAYYERTFGRARGIAATEAILTEAARGRRRPRRERRRAR